jgi:hypothetical protein
MAYDIQGQVSKNASGIPAFPAEWNPDSDGARANGILMEQTDTLTIKYKTETTNIMVGNNSAYTADVPTTTGYGRIVARRGW